MLMSTEFRSRKPRKTTQKLKLKTEPFKGSFNQKSRPGKEAVHRIRSRSGAPGSPGRPMGTRFSIVARGKFELGCPRGDP